MAAFSGDIYQVQQCIAQLREIDGNIAAEHYCVHCVPTTVLKELLQYCNTVITTQSSIADMQEAEYLQYIHWRSVIIAELLERGVF